MIDMYYESLDSKKYIVYKRQEQDKTDKVALGMITNNVIEGCLPFFSSQIDDEVTYKYDVTGLSTLEEYLGGSVKRDKLIKVLEQFVSLIEKLEEYMLDSRMIVLEKSNIYVNTKDGSIYVVILPVEHEVQSIELFFKTLVFGIQCDTLENCSYLAKLLTFFNSGNEFSFAEFSKLIKSIKENKQENGRPSIQERINRQESVQHNNVAAPYVNQVQSRPQQAMGTNCNYGTYQQSAPMTGYQNNPMSGYQSQKAGNISFEVPKSNNVVPEIPPIGNTPFSTDSDAIEDNTKEKKRLFGRKKKKDDDKKSKKEESKKDKKIEKEKSKPVFSFNGIAIPGRDTIESVKEDSIQPVNNVPKQEIKMETHSVGLQNFGETSLLTEDNDTSNETSLLVEKSYPSRTPYLIRKQNGQVFELHKQVSSIGRSANQSDFAMSGNTSIGRVHAFVYIRNGRVFIKDNFSKNGTFVNGERVTDEIEIKSGDIIKLSDEELELEFK